MKRAFHLFTAAVGVISSFSVILLLLGTISMMTVPAIFAQAHPRGGGPPVMSMPMPLIAPIFLQNDSVSSAIDMVNSALQPGDATIYLRDLKGQQIFQRTVHFPAHSRQTIEISELLRAAHSTATAGSAVITLSPDLKGMTIVAQLSITYQKASGVGYLDEELAMLNMNGSKTLRGIADGTNGQLLVAVTSVSKSVQRIVMQCFNRNGPAGSESLKLRPGVTILAQACGEVLDHSVDFDKIQAFGKKSEGPIAVSLTTNEHPADFAAFGIAVHGQNGSDRFLSGANFMDPKMAMSSTTIFTGVPIGESRLLTEGEYTPHLTVANFSNRPAKVSLQLAVTQAGRTPEFSEVRSFLQRPNSTNEVTLAGLKGDSDLQNSFILSSDAKPGELVSKLAARGTFSLPEIELIGKDEMDGENAGGHPWSVSDGTLATLFLFNHTNTPQRFTVRIAGVDARWDRSYEVQPRETRALSINDVIGQHVKDKNGKTLPLELKTGIVNWWTNIQAGSRADC